MWSGYIAPKTDQLFIALFQRFGYDPLREEKRNKSVTKFKVAIIGEPP